MKAQSQDWLLHSHPWISLSKLLSSPWQKTSTARPNVKHVNSKKNARKNCKLMAVIPVWTNLKFTNDTSQFQNPDQFNNAPWSQDVVALQRFHPSSFAAALQASQQTSSALSRNYSARSQHYSNMCDDIIFERCRLNRCLFSTTQIWLHSWQLSKQQVLCRTSTSIMNPQLSKTVREQLCKNHDYRLIGLASQPDWFTYMEKTTNVVEWVNAPRKFSDDTLRSRCCWPVYQFEEDVSTPDGMLIGLLLPVRH